GQDKSLLWLVGRQRNSGFGAESSNLSIKKRALWGSPQPTSSGYEIPPMQGGGINATLDMTSEEVAEKALIGLAKGKSLVVTGWKNKCIAFFGGKAPRVWVTRVGGAILRKMRLKEG
ncbi:MAG: hypothetical protein ACPGSB_08250, partial [Opitutales bacterium]